MYQANVPDSTRQEVLSFLSGSQAQGYVPQSVEISTMGIDLEDTKEGLTDNQKYLAKLGMSCETKTKEWEEIKKTRAEELLALAETIKVLNDDDSLELFKKTVPSASSSFAQVVLSTKGMK